MSHEPDVIKRAAGDSITLLLDAMGVIYSAGDDVAELLIPFVKERHGCADARVVEEHYMAASLGTIDADAFWQAVGLSPDVEDEYLERFTLVPGIEHFLDLVQPRVKTIACLSNDVSRWSMKLRKRFGLEKWIGHWTISADVQMRKPSPEIYRLCIDRLDVEPGQVLFIDDRARNLDSAAEVGMSTVLFDRTGTIPTLGHVAVRSFSQILDLIYG